MLMREYTNYLSKQARLVELPDPTGADGGLAGLGTSSQGSEQYISYMSDPLTCQGNNAGMM